MRNVTLCRRFASFVCRWDFLPSWQLPHGCRLGNENWQHYIAGYSESGDCIQSLPVVNSSKPTPDKFMLVETKTTASRLVASRYEICRIILDKIAFWFWLFQRQNLKGEERKSWEFGDFEEDRRPNNRGKRAHARSQATLHTSNHRDPSVFSLIWHFSLLFPLIRWIIEEYTVGIYFEPPTEHRNFQKKYGKSITTAMSIRWILWQSESVDTSGLQFILSLSTKVHSHMDGK